MDTILNLSDIYYTDMFLITIVKQDGEDDTEFYNGWDNL
jgi:hypothetical protein